MKNESFRIYLKEWPEYPPVAIITVVEFANNHFYSEYFVLFPDKEELCIGGRCDFGKSEPQKKELESERDMARDVATLKVWDYLMAKFRETNDGLYREFARDRRNVSEDPDGLSLRNLCRSGYFKKGLAYVGSRTLCDSLKEYIQRIRKAHTLEWKAI